MKIAIPVAKLLTGSLAKAICALEVRSANVTPCLGLLVDAGTDFIFMRWLLGESSSRRVF